MSAPASHERDKHDGHEHDHGHGGHHHDHAAIPGDEADEKVVRAFRFAVFLNCGLVAAEVVFGMAANSVGLLSDAGHNFSDVLSIVLAWWAHEMAKKPASGRLTFGYRKLSVLAALGSALLLMLVTGGLMWEAMNRFLNPQPVEGAVVAIVAGIGIAINGYTAYLFMKGGKEDLNVRGAFLHLASDAAVSVGVLVSGVLIVLYGWTWTDPLISLIIGVVLLFATWGLLKEAVLASLDAVPASVDLEQVRHYLAELDDVEEVHDLHVWALGTREIALSCHLVMPGERPTDRRLGTIAAELRHQFNVKHVTLQTETGDPDASPYLCNPQCDPPKGEQSSP